MSTVFTIISPNAIHDIHGLIINVQSKTPNMLYEFGKDESKYASGFQPDVFAWIHRKSTRFLDWKSERLKDKDRNWRYEIRIPACSNCPLWELAFALIEKIAEETGGLIFTEEMDIDEDTGLDKEGFAKWKSEFSCEKKFAAEVEITISLSESEGDVTIFGILAPFTFNKNIIAELKLKRSVIKEFEKRMLQLQNAVLDEAYTNPTTVLISGQNKKEYKAKLCTGMPLTLIINEDLEYIGFIKSGTQEASFVPAKKVREVMPARCFFDEYSFYIDNAAFALWDSIVEKAKEVSEGVE